MSVDPSEAEREWWAAMEAASYDKAEAEYYAAIEAEYNAWLKEQAPKEAQ